MSQTTVTIDTKLVPKKLKIVWSDGQSWHHDFDIVARPYGVDVLVVHVTKESVEELLDAD